MAEPAPTPPLYSTKGKIAIAVLLAIAAAGLFLAYTRTDTGPPGEDVVTSGGVPLDGFGVRPQRNAEVLSQPEVGIDLKPGWEAVLAVNGVEIPPTDVRTVPPEFQVFFTPGEGRAVEEFSAGRNCVTATYWRSADGRTDDSPTYTWCFDVT
jgi:hypothetical protein